MTKEQRAFVAGLVGPLILAAAGWINSHANLVEARAQKEKKFEALENYREYIIQVMREQEMIKEAGCEIPTVAEDPFQGD